MKYITR